MSKQIDFTKPLSKADQQYVDDRPWLLVDAVLQGIEAEDDGDDAQDGEDVVDYDEFTVAELTDEVNRRNSEREDQETWIQPADKKKATLIEALTADDEAQAESDDEDEDQEEA